MPANTRIWCDRAPYDVEESRTDVLEAIDSVCGGNGFIYVTPQAPTVMHGGSQICLNPRYISAVWALPGRGV